MLMGLGAVPLRAGAIQASLAAGAPAFVAPPLDEAPAGGMPRWLLPVGIGAAALAVVVIMRRRSAAKVAHNPRRRRSRRSRRRR